MNDTASKVRYEDFTQWHIDGRDMSDLHADVPISHWTKRVIELRAGYDEDSCEDDFLHVDLALEMFRTLGYYPAHQLAEKLRETADGAVLTWEMDGYHWPSYVGRQSSKEHRELFAALGHEQTQLLAAWLISTDTRLMLRDSEYLNALAMEGKAAETAPATEANTPVTRPAPRPRPARVRKPAPRGTPGRLF